MKHKPVWQKIKYPPFKELILSQFCDACIVGAGIAGLCTAYELIKRGKKVIILDKETGFSNQSSLSSCHISCALDDLYSNMQTILSKNDLKVAAESHQKAITKLKSIIDEEKIDCDWDFVEGYLINSSDDENLMDKEFQAATKAGVRGVALNNQIPSYGARNFPSLKFSNLAQFNILKFLVGLRKVIETKGGLIFGNCFVDTHKHIGERIVVKLHNPYTISCENLIYATNVPIHHRVDIHTKEAAYRTYCVGIEIPKHSFPKILLWDTSDPYHYVRISEEADCDVLIVGGEDHRVGVIPEKSPFTALINWAKNFLKVSGKVKYEWSGQIIETLDGLGYIGKSFEEKNVYEISGDSGHGITHGVIASILIPELIAGREHPWQDTYRPNRVNLSTITTYLKENTHAVAQNIDWFTFDSLDFNDIPKGKGQIIQQGIHKIAAYKDNSGVVHKCSAVCPHLGAIVRWNDVEKSWDCPFHGSRFDACGKLKNGPAHNDLSEAQEVNKVNIDEEKIEI